MLEPVVVADNTGAARRQGGPATRPEAPPAPASRRG